MFSIPSNENPTSRRSLLKGIVGGGGLAALGFAGVGPTLAQSSSSSVVRRANMLPRMLAGVQVHAVWDRYGPTFGNVHREVLGTMKSAGAGVIRVDVWWEAFEPQRGAWNDNPYGGKLAATLSWCRDNGIRVMVTPTRSPQWAVPGRSTPRLPDNAADCRGFGQRLAKWLARWGDTVYGVEFWNEPDLTSFEAGGPRPAYYVTCLREFYNGVKTSNPGLRVIYSGPSLVAVTAGGSARTNFIGQSYDHVRATGGRRPWDVMAAHVYPGSDAPTATSTGTQQWRLDHVRYLLNRMDAEGDRSPLAITEMGWSAHSNAGIVGQPAQPPWETGVSSAQQAAFTSQALKWLAATGRVDCAIVYNEWAKGTSATAGTTSDRHQYGFGVLDFYRRPTSTLASLRF
jgi:hypothetical protein